MPVIRTADAVAYDLHGARFTSYAAPARGSEQLCAWHLEVAPGSGGAPHRVNREEVMRVLTGELVFTIDGHAETLRPDDVAVVPAGSTVNVANPSGEAATAWVTTSVGLEATMADGSAISPPWVR
jgi:mannose-6-phosphate isomerase-like protein (cupin superfamily)